MRREEMVIEPAELLNKLEAPTLRLFDATVTDAAYQKGHIPGAAYFDHELFSDPASPYESTILPMDRLKAQIGASGIASDSEVVIYAAGMLPYAARAWWVLRAAGHPNVRVLNGGLAGWRAAGGALEQTARRYAPTVFTGAPRPAWFASKEEVLAALNDPNQAVINVLPLESYQAAHITGSQWLGCLELMQGMEAFLPAEQIAARLQGTAHYHRLITYCGGGIAAALNAMAHIMNGQENVAVYDGSLWEWIAEGLPMTGSGDWQVWKRS